MLLLLYLHFFFERVYIMAFDDHLFAIAEDRLHLAVQQRPDALKHHDIQDARFADADKIGFGKLLFQLVELEVALVHLVSGVHKGPVVHRFEIINIGKAYVVLLAVASR